MLTEHFCRYLGSSIVATAVLANQHCESKDNTDRHVYVANNHSTSSGELTFSCIHTVRHYLSCHRLFKTKPLPQKSSRQ